MYNIATAGKKVRPDQLIRLINIRKATSADLNGIYEVACTVGNQKKDPDQGFLIDDYTAAPERCIGMLAERIENLSNVYVAEYGKIYGFLISYTKEEWLSYHPRWIESVQWRPDFEKEKLDRFALVDKTAITADLTGMGIGSKLYTRMISDLKEQGIENIFAETLIAPKLNFASLHFRVKQDYAQCGVSYYEYLEKRYTDLVFYKHI